MFQFGYIPSLQRRGGRAISKMDPFRKKARTGWSLTSEASECVCETWRVSDHPVCGSSVASRLLIDAAAPPLCKEGNVPKLKHVCLSKFIWDTTLSPVDSLNAQSFTRL